jgi:hypothetical protein
MSLGVPLLVLFDNVFFCLSEQYTLLCFLFSPSTLRFLPYAQSLPSSLLLLVLIKIHIFTYSVHLLCICAAKIDCGSTFFLENKILLSAVLFSYICLYICLLSLSCSFFFDNRVFLVLVPTNWFPQGVIYLCAPVFISLFHINNTF